MTPRHKKDPSPQLKKMASIEEDFQSREEKEESELRIDQTNKVNVMMKRMLAKLDVGHSTNEPEGAEISTI